MTIFGGSWCCVACGAEYCFDCERVLPNSNSRKGNNASVEKTSTNGRLLNCAKGQHARTNFFASTTFELQELRQQWLNMVLFAERANVPWKAGNARQDLISDKVNVQDMLLSMEQLSTAVPGQDMDLARAATSEAIPRSSLRQFLRTRTQAYEMSTDETQAPSGHPFYRTDRSSLTESLFDRMWSDGIPIVVDGCGKGVSTSCTPEEFMKEFPIEPCCE